MIADWDTNCLFLSDRLEGDDPQIFASLRSALKSVPIEIISETSDIWCRDFMPIQIDEESFCLFVYRPDYLRGHEHLITPPNKCRLPFMETYQIEPIVLDGGNVVASRTKVILTDKVFKENPDIKRPRLQKRLEELFQAKCIFIPKQAGDDVGHSDGVVRFISENRVLVNDYSTVDPSYGAKLRAIFEKHGLEVETCPMFEEEGGEQGDIPSAVGIYINFLRVGNKVVLPGFGRPEDQAALQKVQQVMPDTKVFQVSCRRLAEKGGLLNCISWTVKRPVPNDGPKAVQGNASRTDRDRRVRQADRLARILSVLKLIQSRGKWNTKSIARELEVTERTVYRDLDVLKYAGVPHYFDDDQQSYRVRADYRFPVPNLTDEEVIGQAVATAITKAAGLDVAGSASPTTQKIAATADDDTKQLLADIEQLVCVLGLQLADHSHCHETIGKLQQALIERRRIAGTYSSPHEVHPVELRLNPIRLCLIKNAWYLIAQAVGGEPKTYRVARFGKVEVLSEAATVPEVFDVRAYFGNAWAVFRGSQTFDIRIRFVPEAARLVTETQWHATQQVTPAPDGSVVLSFRIDGLEEISNWLLGWSGHVEVLEPLELRQMVASKLREGLELNQ